MIYIGADHGGFELKEELKKYMDKLKIRYEDLGTNSEESVDYPDYASRVASKVAKANSDDVRGVLVCGTGLGMCIAANKVNGIRATLLYSEDAARLAREHNNSNIACFGGRMQKTEDVKKMFKIWYDTKFSGDERHKRRLAEAEAL